MKAVVYSFSKRGAELSKSVRDILLAFGYDAKAETLPKYAKEARIGVMLPDYKTACKEAFTECGIIIFVGAAGIAVRAIAPYIKSKMTDPAVISMDEQAKFVIPLLSGHIGGANELSRAIADKLGSVACVTTATDVNGLFAVDEWAARNNMIIDSMLEAKYFAAALVNNQLAGIYSQFDIKGSLPGNCLTVEENNPSLTNGLAVTVYDNVKPFLHTVRLIPKIVHLGIGCRRNTECAKIEQLVYTKLKQLHIDKRAVCSIASVDLKKDETGLLEFAEKNNWQANFYTADELNNVEGEFAASAFVSSIVGVNNVCERSAVLDSKNGRVLLHKTSLDGVTLAIAIENIEIDFSKTGLKTN